MKRLTVAVLLLASYLVGVQPALGGESCVRV